MRGKVVNLAKFQKRIEVRRMAIKVDRQNGFCARRDSSLHGFWIEIEGGVIDIHVHRFRIHVRDGPACGDKGAGRGDHLVTLADVEQKHSDVQSGSAAVEGDAVVGATIMSEILFELGDIRSETKRAVVESAGDGGIDFLADWPHLCREIEIGNGLNFGSYSCHCAAGEYWENSKFQAPTSLI